MTVAKKSFHVPTGNPAAGFEEELTPNADQTKMPVMQSALASATKAVVPILIKPFLVSSTSQPKLRNWQAQPQTQRSMHKDAVECENWRSWTNTQPSCGAHAAAGKQTRWTRGRPHSSIFVEVPEQRDERSLLKWIRCEACGNYLNT